MFPPGGGVNATILVWRANAFMRAVCLSQVVALGCTLHLGFQPRWTAFSSLNWPEAPIPTDRYKHCSLQPSGCIFILTSHKWMSNWYAASYLEEFILIASFPLHAPNASTLISTAPRVSLFPPLVKYRRDPRDTVGWKECHPVTSIGH